MNAAIIAANAAVIASMVVAGAAQATPKIGEPAPAFSTVDSNGKTVQLADYRGKFVVLEWTNNDCPFVKKHYSTGNMQALQKEATDKGVVWLSVISSAPGKQGHVDGARANALTKERGAAPSDVLIDDNGVVGKAYDAKTTPHMFLINPEGKLVYMGGIDDLPSAEAGDVAKAKPYLKLAMNEALAGKPITEAVTKPYGCSVKY